MDMASEDTSGGQREGVAPRWSAPELLRLSGSASAMAGSVSAFAESAKYKKIKGGYVYGYDPPVS